MPPTLGYLYDALKGYRGDLTAPQALDLLLQDGNALLIDIRAIREKEQSGLPDVPGSASGRLLELEFAKVDAKIRGLLKDATATECELTALQISNLKRVRLWSALRRGLVMGHITVPYMHSTRSF